MYYGNGSVGSQEDVTNVWSNGFISVWHLDENAGTVSDSTSNGYDGTVSGASYNSSAYVNGGYDFVRSENDEIEMSGTANNLSLTTFSVEVWMHTPDNNIVNDYYMVTQSLYCDSLESWTLNIADDVGHEDEARFAIKESDTQTNVYGITLTDDQWHYVVGVRSLTHLLMYVDGSYVDSIADNRAGETILSSANISLGSAICTEDEDFNGTADEVRISNVVRDLDWIETTHNNLSSPSTFHSTPGAEESSVGYCP
jgi:hypothetical protein